MDDDGGKEKNRASSKEFSNRSKRSQTNREQDIKLIALRYLRSGSSKAAVSRKLGIAESTLRGWAKDPKLHEVFKQTPKDKAPIAMDLSRNSSPINLPSTSSTQRSQTATKYSSSARPSTSRGTSSDHRKSSLQTQNSQFNEDIFKSLVGFLFQNTNELSSHARVAPPIPHPNFPPSVPSSSLVTDINECAGSPESGSSDSGRGSMSPEGPKVGSLYSELSDELREKCDAVIASNGGTEEIAAVCKDLGMTWFSDMLEEAEDDDS